MTKRLQLAIFLMSSAVACIPIGAHASDEHFVIGALYGSGTTICELNKRGQLSREFAMLWLAAYFEKDPDVPASSRRDVLERISTKYPQCPLPQ